MPNDNGSESGVMLNKFSYRMRHLMILELHKLPWCHQNDHDPNDYVPLNVSDHPDMIADCCIRTMIAWQKEMAGEK